ncbi:hypothetical protein NP493_132g00035 [Ridgeia piscesae]|uniref:Uncharacterized protein n=1 Tax=Ridgeia piscesae TaxID=27915 RepID=A0AAD9P5B0_RIDPI|nr:hypothetical protein NP493_132g00035 [Ridgeia piscesae]
MDEIEREEWEGRGEGREREMKSQLILTSYVISLVGSTLVVISLVLYIICTSANVIYLKESPFPIFDIKSSFAREASRNANTHVKTKTEFWNVRIKYDTGEAAQVTSEMEFTYSESVNAGGQAQVCNLELNTEEGNNKKVEPNWKDVVQTHFESSSLVLRHKKKEPKDWLSEDT